MSSEPHSDELTCAWSRTSWGVESEIMTGTSCCLIVARSWSEGTNGSVSWVDGAEVS